MNLPHHWDLTPEEAIAVQRELRQQVRTTNGFDPEAVRSVAGIDVSLKGDGQAAIAVLSFPDLKPLDQAVATAKLTFPYVPGLLSFRESPLVLAAWEKLHVRPDLLMVDGQGYAHPRRFGIACHLGLLLDLPAIGSAKSLLTGRHGMLPEDAGARVDLVDKGEVIGKVVRTRAGVKPLYVSIGHRVSLDTAVELVLSCCRKYRLPEPQRAAHNAASGYKR